LFVRRVGEGEKKFVNRFFDFLGKGEEGQVCGKNRVLNKNYCFTILMVCNSLSGGKRREGMIFSRHLRATGWRTTHVEARMPQKDLRKRLGECNW